MARIQFVHGGRWLERARADLESPMPPSLEWLESPARQRQSVCGLSPQPESRPGSSEWAGDLGGSDGRRGSRETEGHRLPSLDPTSVSCICTEAETVRTLCHRGGLPRLARIAPAP